MLALLETCQIVCAPFSLVSQAFCQNFCQSTSWEPYQTLGNIYDDQQSYDEAERLYLKAISVGGNDASGAYNNLSRLMILKGDDKAGAKLARKGLEIATQSISIALLNKNLGWSLLKQKRYADAKKHLLKAIDIDRPDPHCLLGQVYAAEGNLDAASKQLLFCVSIEANTPEAQKWRKIITESILINQERIFTRIRDEL